MSRICFETKQPERRVTESTECIELQCPKFYDWNWKLTWWFFFYFFCFLSGLIRWNKENKFFSDQFPFPTFSYVSRESGDSGMWSHNADDLLGVFEFPYIWGRRYWNYCSGIGCIWLKYCERKKEKVFLSIKSPTVTIYNRVHWK